MDHSWAYFVIYIILVSNSAYIEADSICNAVQSNISSVTLETSSFSDWSSDGQCHCELSFSDGLNQLDLELDVESFYIDSKQDKDSCSPLMVFYLAEHTFFHCPGNRSFTSRLMLREQASESPLRFRLYNPDGKNVKARMSLSSYARETFTIGCQSQDFSLDLDRCPCVDEYPSAGGLLPPAHQSTPTSKRVLVGFMCALAFLLCVGIFLLIAFLVKRDYIKPVGPLKYLVNKKNLKDPYDSAKEKEAAVASNLGFVGDSQDSINKLPRTPITNSIHDLYATVDLSAMQTELPFTPDPNLRLNLKSPYESEAQSRYRGSLDSGLYSEISSERTDKQSKGTNNSMPVIGATSLETLQALGPGHRFEPPAGQSSPKPPPRVAKDLEVIYAKPDKSKKAKYKNKAANGDAITQPTGPRSEYDNLPVYNPQRLRSKSGSTTSLNDDQRMNLSGSKSGSVSMLPHPSSAAPDQPKKKKKKRKQNTTGHTVSGSEQSLDGAGSMVSNGNLSSGYDPKPLQRRTGSSSSINDRLNLSGSVSMIPNVIYEGVYAGARNSRSSSELHMTDAGNESHGSRVSMETDV